MKRGAIITMSVKGSIASKPRPAIIVQATEFIRSDRPVLVCPLTSEAAYAPFFRIDIDPTEENGLRVRSQAMIDRLGAVLPREVGAVIGHAAASDLARIELALVNILGLSPAAALLTAAKQ